MKRPLNRVGHRFFSEALIAGQSRIELDRDEAHHLSKVLRCALGDEVLLFDGSGLEYRSRVSQVSKSQVTLDVLDWQLVDRELPFQLMLGVALPRGDRQRWLVEKAVELGVTHLVPLETQRGVVQPTNEACQKLRRTVIEASKQCGRNKLMQVGPPAPIADFLEAKCADSESVARSAIRYLATPEGDTWPSTGWNQERHKQLPSEKHSVMVAIGPEGGFTLDEIAWARKHSWELVSLGVRILRVETAAVAICAAIGLGQNGRNEG